MAVAAKNLRLNCRKKSRFKFLKTSRSALAPHSAHIPALGWQRPNVPVCQLLLQLHSAIHVNVRHIQTFLYSLIQMIFAYLLSILISVRTIVQKTDSPIVDSIGQNYRPMRQRSDSFEIALLCLTKICFESIGSPSHRTITNINLLLTRMWANAQPDGRPAEHRWRPLFNAAKFG